MYEKLLSSDLLIVQLIQSKLNINYCMQKNTQVD